MPWETFAGDLLTAAAADVEVARAVVAPGPGFARDCRMIAVHLAAVRHETLSYCAVLPILALQVTFVADCVPTSDDNATPPPADDVTAWTSAFLHDAELIHTGILAFADACANGDCERVQVGDGIPSGPSGGVSSIAWPVEIRLT